MKTSTLILILFFITSINVCKAQDPQFTQFYANRIYLNPAYAGGNKCPNFILGYRNQAPGIDGNFVTKSISYDTYVAGVKGGIAGLIMQDVNGVGSLKTTDVSLIYSYVLHLNKHATFRAGFKGSYFQNSVDRNKLKFADMVDQNQGGFTGSTSEVDVNGGASAGADLSVGGLLTYNNMYAGLAINHITKSPQYMFGLNSRLTRSFLIHAGLIHEIKTGSGKILISPNLLFEQQGKFRQINVGTTAKISGVLLGVWYRHKDAIALVIGVDQKRYKVGYSYDYNISKVGAVVNSGAHEISLTLKLKCKNKKRKYRIATCPAF